MYPYTNISHIITDWEIYVRNNLITRKILMQNKKYAVTTYPPLTTAVGTPLTPLSSWRRVQFTFKLHHLQTDYSIQYF